MSDYFSHHVLVVDRDNTIVVFFSFVLTMAGEQLTLEGLSEDVKVTNERLAQLEGAQIEVEGRLTAIEETQRVSNTHLQDILARLKELRAAPPVNNIAATRDSTGGHATSRARRVPPGDPQHPAAATEADTINQRQPANAGDHHAALGDNYEDYAGDTEDDTTVNNNNTRAHRQLRFNRQGMGRAPPRHDVRDNDHFNGKIKFTMPAFNGKYNPDDYLE